MNMFKVTIATITLLAAGGAVAGSSPSLSPESVRVCTPIQKTVMESAVRNKVPADFARQLSFDLQTLCLLAYDSAEAGVPEADIIELADQKEFYYEGVRGMAKTTIHYAFDSYRKINYKQ